MMEYYAAVKTEVFSSNVERSVQYWKKMAYWKEGGGSVMPLTQAIRGSLSIESEEQNGVKICPL